MDRRFTDLSRLKFDEVSGELKEKLQEQKIQERPFAYEFYHQFRKFWDSGYVSLILPYDIVIQAEVNKSYQNIPRLNRIPDFLFHKPGSNEGNFAVVEFKLATSNINAIIDDLEKLANFREEPLLHYTYLVEVVIGDTEKLLRCRKELLEKFGNKTGESVEITVVEFDTSTWTADHYEVNFPSTNPITKTSSP